MKFEVKTTVTKVAQTLLVNAGVRYWENATVNGIEDDNDEPTIPCVVNGRWCPTIDIPTGTITNWTQGTTADVHYKVCDDGEYTLVDAEGGTILVKDGYVPDIMCPEGEGYGDYIIMKIDENGKIAKWKPTTEGFDLGDED